MKAIIIDDEPLAHKVILAYAQEVSFLNISNQYYLASEALAEIPKSAIDLIFLDIQMPKMNGLDFLRSLRIKPQVIITSAYRDYALDGFDLNVCDYLLKPFSFKRFLKALNKAKESMLLKENKDSANSLFTTSHQSSIPPLMIKSERRLFPVYPNDIFFLEAFGNYVKVWISDRYHLTLRTLSSFESDLDQNKFIQIHKSYIINKDKIKFVQKNAVTLLNDKSVPVSKSRRHFLGRF